MASSSLSRQAGIPLFWRGQLAFGLLLAGFGITSRILIHDDIAIALILTSVMEPAAVVMTVLMRGHYRELAEVRPVTRRTVGQIILICLAAALAEVGLAALLRQVFDWQFPDGRLLRWTVFALTYYLIVFACWSLLYFWISSSLAARDDRERAVMAEAAAARAELGRLRLQLDPHLIFNALNGIATEIHERPALAERMLHDVSDYLRMSLQNSGLSICLLVAELAVVQAFLDIQKARFGNRLHYRVEIDPKALNRQLPSFVLQVLVENAVKHGLRGHAGTIEVLVAARVEDDRLFLEVRNSGRLHNAWPGQGQERPTSGVGLANLLQRLDLHYPGRHRFMLCQQSTDVVADLRMEGAACYGSS